jgi:hypothetical protein
MATRLFPRQVYPFMFDLRVAYEFGEQGPDGGPEPSR